MRFLRSFFVLENHYAGLRCSSGNNVSVGANGARDNCKPSASDSGLQRFCGCCVSVAFGYEYIM